MWNVSHLSAVAVPLVLLLLGLRACCSWWCCLTRASSEGTAGPPEACLVQTALTVGVGCHSTAAVKYVLLLPKSLHFEDCQRVRRLDVTRDLWVIRHVGFRGITLPKETWGPFSQLWLCRKRPHRPKSSCVWTMMDASLTVGLHVGGKLEEAIQGPGTAASACDSCGTGGGPPEDNSGDPPHRLAPDHSPHSDSTPHGNLCP